MSNNRGKQLLQLAFIVVSAFACFLCISVFKRYTLLEEEGRRGLVLKQGIIKNYGQSEIDSFYYNMKRVEPMLLVFDGQTFKAYTFGPKMTFRYVKIIPLMVHALETNLPERFQPGQPIFQMIFSVSDLLATECVNKFGCPIQRFFPPIVSFSAVSRDETILPTARSFPNPVFMGCMYDWKMNDREGCLWPEVDKSIQWDDLDNQIVWRGSDHRFLQSYKKYKNKDNWLEEVFTRDALANMTKMDVVNKLFDRYDELSPRWKAAAMTLKTNVQDPTSHHWINAMFTGNSKYELRTRFAERGIDVSEDKGMDSKVMSRYKYQIDLGGGGGTTWETLTKLRMPGVLFHHKTPTKDWYYDLMEPWVHYIPVQADLADLFDRYEGAESHPEQVKKIAAESTKLADYLLSDQYLEKVYQELFVDYFAKVVEAYQPNGKSWEECLEEYTKQGIPLQPVSVCNHITCTTEWKLGTTVDTFSHVKVSPWQSMTDEMA